MNEPRAVVRADFNDLEGAKQWIKNLAEAGLSFHFEDDPEDIGNYVDGRWVDTFFTNEVPVLRERVAKLYGFQWGAYVCPIGFEIAAMNWIGGEAKEPT